MGRCLVTVGVGVQDGVYDFPPVTPARIPFDLLGAVPREILEHPSLGIKLDQSADHVLVESVFPDSGAALAGLEAGDVVTDVDGVSVTDLGEVVAELALHDLGDEVTLRMLRDGEELEVGVTLTRRSHMTARESVHSGPLSDHRAGFASVFRHATVVDPEECGGPVVGLDGRVVGINIARAGRTTTYAIPADVVQSLLPAMQAGEFPPPAGG